MSLLSDERKEALLQQVNGRKLSDVIRLDVGELLGLFEEIEERRKQILDCAKIKEENSSTLFKWEEFESLARLLIDFHRLDPEKKEMLLLMIDGLQYRRIQIGSLTK